MRLAWHTLDMSNDAKSCRYFNIWRNPEAELEDRSAAASRCGALTSRLLALIIGSRGLLPFSALTRLIRVSQCEADWMPTADISCSININKQH